jgi:enoyl-CoA hydratase
MKGGDIYEGIRALLVDKDGQPRWQPNSLEQVTHQSIDAHFQHLGELELTAF